MRYRIQFTVEAKNQQHAVSLRDRGRAWLEQQGAVVEGYEANKLTARFRVLGVDCKKREQVDVEVEAMDPEEAKAAAEAADDAIVVASVQRLAG